MNSLCRAILWRPKIAFWNIQAELKLNGVDKNSFMWYNFQSKHRNSESVEAAFYKLSWLDVIEFELFCKDEWANTSVSVCVILWVIVMQSAMMQISKLVLFLCIFMYMYNNSMLNC